MSKTNETWCCAAASERELTADELEHVSGGKALPKLLEAAVKGHVFTKVEIHGTATYGV